MVSPNAKEDAEEPRSYSQIDEELDWGSDDDNTVVLEQRDVGVAENDYVHMGSLDRGPEKQAQVPIAGNKRKADDINATSQSAASEGSLFCQEPPPKRPRTPYPNTRVSTRGSNGIPLSAQRLTINLKTGPGPRLVWIAERQQWQDEVLGWLWPTQCLLSCLENLLITVRHRMNGIIIELVKGEGIWRESRGEAFRTVRVHPRQLQQLVRNGEAFGDGYPLMGI